ncbi:MAG: methyltransferase domain-containing protein [Burkholderiales bacterium]|nr:methyltransferase domain-containing protein [Burkholderiales bacterium]
MQLEVDFVPSEPEVVEAMLALADVRAGDMVYDLGCGDGRIVITAARKYGARGVGIDIDPARIAEANENAKRARVADKVRFRQGDVFAADFHDATVVTLFLRTDYNRKLRPRLLAQLKPGTRIVSHEHDFAEDWPPEKTVRVAGKPVHRWTVPERK